MDNLITLLMGAFVFLIAGLAIAFILAKLYRKASKDLAYVRTGAGGQKVIKDGGAIVLPMFHNITPVNMQTLKLTVSRRNTDALITNDPLRCDVMADFFVRVKPDVEGIANAAQTLGDRTQNVDQLRDLVESKFIDALRAVAATTSLQNLHEQRQEFVQRVQEVSAHDLSKNGLELESVSLTHLDQTSQEHLDERNSFDAQGLRKLAEITEKQREERNNIQASTRVAIETRNLDADRESLRIERDREHARLEQQQEIAEQTAAQETAIAKKQAMEREASERARIEADRAIAEQEILSERQIEIANISRNRDIEEQRIAQQRAIETAEIERKKSIELANQGSQIAIAQKSQETAAADAEANAARAEAVNAEELVITNRETARAERQRSITVIQAREQAERDAVSITVTAETEKKAAEDRADAVLTEAKANRDRIAIEAEAEATRIRQVAQAEADAISAKAAADAEANDVEASYQRELNEARNLLSPDQTNLIRLQDLYQRLPEIFAAQAKPLEKIESIRILHVPGMGGLSNAPVPNGENVVGHAVNGATPQGLGGDLMNLMAHYRLHVPILDEISQHIRGEVDNMDVPGSKKAEPNEKS